ncbi:ABC transporter substrate-binding protein [Pseudoruegeria sp. SK021]|uniref:ABC transporter substrate-binding protein n=1 Tax=Pseudoruegeria sp. SK021 TaxID=1933035 RepID=UPI000A22B2D6|nr:ABC transporter substrate-binding protein [Pseudoruegeria sp. SK021]OSP54718.1 hypothetical protein BV911_11175 [Pseudoruegeria sp. SK021]
MTLHTPSRLARQLMLSSAIALSLAATVPVAAMAQDNETITIASANDITSLDPHMLDSNHPTGSVIWSIFDSLVRRAPDGSTEPRLATSWERIDDVTWRFNLREGVTFTNGEPFNAEAVKINMERMNTTPWATVQQLHDQTGLIEVNVVDDYTIELVTEAPTVNMLYWLAEAFIGAPQYLTDTAADKVASEPVGSGPYKLDSWNRDDRLTLVVNDTYWGDAPDAETVVFRVVPETSSRLNELRAGTADVIVDITPDTAGQADSDISEAVYVEGLRKMHMGINIEGEQPALKDIKVRQALNHAVDVDTIITALLDGKTVPIPSIVNPPNNNPDLAAFDYDPEKAKALLAEAGYADGFPLTIQYSTRFAGGKEVSEVVASYLQQVGIEPTVEAVELGQFRQMLSGSSTKGIYFMGWAALINPSVELVILTCGHVDNSSGYCNEEYDALVHEAAQTLDDDARLALEFEAQQTVWNDAPWLYMWRLPVVFGKANNITYDFRADNYVEPYLMTTE